MDIFIAFGTTGSSVSSLFIFSGTIGQIVFGLLISVSTIFALSKPVLQLNNRIERQSRLFTGHSDNYANLLILVSRIKRRGSITEEMNNTFEASEARHQELSKDDDPKPNMRVLSKCEALIRTRHPAAAAWYPARQADTLQKS